MKTVNEKLQDYDSAINGISKKCHFELGLIDTHPYDKSYLDLDNIEFYASNLCFLFEWKHFCIFIPVAKFDFPCPAITWKELKEDNYYRVAIAFITRNDNDNGDDVVIYKNEQLFEYLTLDEM